MNNIKTHTKSSQLSLGDRYYNLILKARKIWQVRIGIYLICFIIYLLSLYDTFVRYPLDIVKDIGNISQHHFIWRTIHEGIITAYIICVGSLLIPLVFELMLYDTDPHWEWEKEFDNKPKIISKRICIGLAILAIVIPLTRPLLPI